MPTINATVFPAEAYVLVEADWTDFPEVTYAAVTRRNTVTGEMVTLRPYIDFDAQGFLLLNCGLGLWWDTEPPLNVPLEYCTVAADVDTAINSNSTFETGVAPWATTTGTLVQSNTFAHTGTWSGLFTPDGATFSPSFIDSTVYSYQAGVPVKAGAWVLSPQGWNSVQLEVTTLSTTGLVVAQLSDIHVVQPAEWTFISFEFTPATSGVINEIEVKMHGLPPNTTLFYWDDISITQPQPVAATACETVTVTSDSVWLKNPLHPCLDIEVGLCSPAMDFDCEEDSRISYAGMADEERNANTVLQEPENRQYPIPVNRTRRAPRSELLLIAHDCTARDAVIATNQPGSPLLFQAPADYCIPDRYISIATLTERRISIDQREDFRLMSLPYVTVERPAGPADGVCGARFEDLCDIYTSWQAMTLSGLDYTDLLLGEASNDGPGSDPSLLRTWDGVEAEFADWDAVEAGGTRDWNELRDGL